MYRAAAFILPLTLAFAAPAAPVFAQNTQTQLHNTDDQGTTNDVKQWGNGWNSNGAAKDTRTKSHESNASAGGKN